MRGNERGSASPAPLMRRKTDYKKKSIELAKRIVREREKRCQWCGRTEGVLHGAHIISVRFAATAARTDNILCLCYRCHFFKWHANPMETATWFNSQWPGRYDTLNQTAQAVTKYTQDDWQNIYMKLKEEYGDTVGQPSNDE